MRRVLVNILLAAVLSVVFCPSLKAQFKSEAFTKSYNDDKTTMKDSIDKVFSFKEYFGALGHKNEMKIGNMFAGSLIFVGGGQIYNKDYWMLPITYGGIGVGIAGGIYHHQHGRDDLAGWSYGLAGLTYWATLLQSVIAYKPDNYPHPGKATLYSLLFPGAGQAYNHEYWKIPIYLGGMACAGYFWATNARNYVRYRDIYIQSGIDPGSVPISAQNALYYRDLYRRYRDYSILAFVAVYVLQIIDANVFAYMHDFEVNDDLSLTVSPAVISPECSYAGVASPNPATQAFGVSLGLKF